jgi:hypothetical protein
VLRRDHHRCQVPGCRHSTFVDVHHLDFRADGGGNEVDNLLTLCSAHHRAVHYGRIRIVGRPSRGLRFLHPDGTAYGDLALLAAGEAPASVLRALSRLGFSERDARRAIARAAGELPLLAMEPLLRRSLALLSEHAFAQTG